MSRLFFVSSASFFFLISFAGCQDAGFDDRIATADRFSADGEYERAITEYENILADRDRLKLEAIHLGAVYVNRGNALMGLGRFKEALSSYDEALGVAENLPEAYANRAICLDRLGDHRGAIANYERALKEKPELGEPPGIIHRILHNVQESSTIKDRLEFLKKQLAESELKRP